MWGSSGIVTAVNVVAGLEAPSGDAIVIDAGTLEVTAQVVESDLAQALVAALGVALKYAECLDRVEPVPLHQPPDRLTD